MKMILRFFTALFVVSTLFACSKKSGGENPDPAVNVENGWKLVSWDGSTAISGYVYLRLEEDQTFVLYQQVGDLATYGYRRYTGTYALSEVTDAGLLLSGIYSDGKAWKDSMWWNFARSRSCVFVRWKRISFRTTPGRRFRPM